MIFKRIRAGTKVGDEEFDAMYPEFIRTLSDIYFTPVNVAKAAAKFLAGAGAANILDIGSGSGKFCMVGSAYTTGNFTGVEQRGQLHALSNEIAVRYRLRNVQFVHANITDISFKAFNAFYFFNPFFENFMEAGMIDDEIALQANLYTEYAAYVRKELEAMPVGTRLATFFSTHRDMPASYQLQREEFDGKLKLMIKV